jgi:hypothetical protein
VRTIPVRANFLYLNRVKIKARFKQDFGKTDEILTDEKKSTDSCGRNGRTVPRSA